MEPQFGDHDAQAEALPRRHSAKLREQVWLPKDQREKICARCGLVKKNMLTLKLAGERFGVCDRCLETLWNLVWHDE